MTVEELIDYLQKFPRDFEIFTSNYTNFGKPNQSCKAIEVVVEMTTESVVIISEK